MEINIPTEQDIFRDKAIQNVNNAFVHITDCNPPLRTGFANLSMCQPITVTVNVSANHSSTT